MVAHAGVCSVIDALDPCPIVCIWEVRPSWITVWQSYERNMAGFRNNYQKKTGSNSIDGHFDRKGHFNC